VLVGAPGSGKGTQGGLLARALRVVHVSVGEIIRCHIQQETELGQRVKQTVAEGELVGDDVAGRLIQEKLEDDIAKSGFVLDGYPRTLPQAIFLDNLLREKGHCVDAAVLLELDEDTLLKRNLGRRHCQQCGRDYNMYFEPPARGEVCDGCGTLLAQREDCREQTIHRRLEEYQRKTYEVIRLYESRGVLTRVNGVGTKVGIHRKILLTLKGRITDDLHLEM
jgi:adenylate kinase